MKSERESKTKTSASMKAAMETYKIERVSLEEKRIVKICSFSSVYYSRSIRWELPFLV